MSVFKDFRFNVVADWIEGTRARARRREARARRLDAARASRRAPRPVESRGAAARSVRLVLQLTVVAVAEHRQIPLHSLEVRAAGHVTRRSVGRLGFVAIELDVELVTDPDLLAEAGAIAKRAQAVCIVTQALDVPLHVRVLARATPVVEEEVLVP